ncbi:Golgi reassembly-stacking protein 2 [Linnemannia hyalina]|uniref:Golgi reassembly-stacking protein 2 n=1 Tax=Linnemannia hyalina TaxID=64524 RepID=A0A9P7Y6F0_9FUNG|nr:Golgi reassembly-stacking protein 2 [Linnemannia hyalina]
MGNSASGDKGRYRHGYHVLMVKENTPAARAGLRPYFDYIMGINGIRLNKEDSVLRDQMESSEDRPVILDIYSTREQALRKVELTPVQKWDNGKDGYIGCSIRFCLFDTINDVVWHILDVAHGSPAMEAGLCAHADYVIGTPLGIMRGERDLYDLVEDYIDDELPLHVYNANTNEVREVIIIPREDWGGQGLLGCDVGFGYLHRLPKRDSSLQTNGSGDVKEKAHPALAHTKKAAYQETPTFGEKQQLEPSVDNTATNKPTPEDPITEKSAHHHHGVHDGNNNTTDTQESRDYKTTAPTPQPAKLETTVSNDERPVPAPATANGDDDEEEAMTVTVTERSNPEQPGAVATATAEPEQSTEAVVTPVAPTDNNTAAPAVTEEEESRKSESLSSPAEKEAPSKSEESETRIPSENFVDSEKTADLARIDSTNETPTPPPHQQQHQQQQNRPQAIAARMKPGIHGRGSFSAGIGGGRGRIGHDGFARNGGISLQDVQAQAQQGSSEYREEKERKEKEAEVDEMSASNESLNVQVLDRDDGSDDDDSYNDENKGGGGLKGEKGERRRTKEEMDNDFHEIVVEGMIRNMSLGSSIFPL